jgi:SelR domain
MVGICRSVGSSLEVLFVGVYVCAECGFELFGSRSKYEHSSPWPAFTETIHENSLSKVPETIPQSKPNALKVMASFTQPIHVPQRRDKVANHGPAPNRWNATAPPPDFS